MPLNNGPPKEVDPTDLWLRMSSLPRPTGAPTTIRARGADIGTVRFWVLSDLEVKRVQSEARRTVEADAAPGSVAFAEMHSAILAAHIIALAARRDGAIEAPAFQSADTVASSFTTDELQAQCNKYLAFRSTAGPSLSELTPAEMDAWVDKLAEGAQRLALNAVQWGPDRLADVPGIDASAGFLDCHFLCWVAARRVLYPDTAGKRKRV